MEKKLEVKNLQVSFRTQAGILKAVRNISFDLYKGETLAIVGESGSGKSVTSKAVIGILSGNSIVEGGEILYDGQDLLKISEDDYHKIRGDKIAMIFQDPLSSLNPIMKVGQQLTEAMILKNKASKRNAKHNIEAKLSLVQKHIDEANASNATYDKKQTANQINIFKNFIIEGAKIEGIYNEANAQAIGLELDIDDLIFLIEKHQKIDVVRRLKEINTKIKLCFHQYVLANSSEVENLIEKIKSFISEGKLLIHEDCIPTLKQLKEILHEAIEKEKPNFFSLGYFKMKKPDFDVSSYSVNELDVMTRSFLDQDFMINFIELAESGVKYAHEFSIEKKKEIVPFINQALQCLEAGHQFDRNLLNSSVKKISELLNVAINRVITHKNSSEYVFSSAIRTSIKAYIKGAMTNPIEEKNYLARKEKYDKLIATGKIPDYQLKPKIEVDLELSLKNLRRVFENLLESINDDIAKVNNFNVNQNVIDIIDYIKEQSSKLVEKMTKKIAKAKAIKLLEEVGITEPAIRFNQYPFEFSGGMRQRIVIAIALSANPDILICDEPTTALDVTIQSQILELINRIKKERNLSVIFITHNLGVVANMADRVAVMYAGKIIEYGTSEDIFYDPQHPYTWALLSSMPDLDTKDKLESVPGTPPNMIFPPKGDAFAPRNKYALEIDFEEEPPLFEVSSTHYAATWLLHPNAPKVTMPKIVTDRINRFKKESAKDGR